VTGGRKFARHHFVARPSHGQRCSRAGFTPCSLVVKPHTPLSNRLRTNRQNVMAVKVDRAHGEHGDAKQRKQEPVSCSTSLESSIASVRRHPSLSPWYSVSPGSPLSITDSSGWCGNESLPRTRVVTGRTYRVRPRTLLPESLWGNSAEASGAWGARDKNESLTRARAMRGHR
jgi:hypothetical protein